MNAHLNRIRMLSLADNYDGELILSQQEKIWGAIKDQNADLADKLMEEDLQNYYLNRKN